MTPFTQRGAPDGAAAHHEAHHEAQDVLPWLANGSLAGAELERVQAHLQACAACRADLAALHTLHAAGPGPGPDCDSERALARVLARLEDRPSPAPAQAAAASPEPAAAPALPGWRERIAANERNWLRAAVALQCAALAVLGAQLALRPQAPPAAYHVLGAGPGQHAMLIVSFRPDTPERELRRIVRANGARIVGGPTVTDAWLVDTDGLPATVLGRLRGEPAVTLAEPLGAEGPP